MDVFAKYQIIKSRASAPLD